MVLALALNLEPTRFILLPLLLARPRPLLQLLAYLIGCLTVSLSFGLLTLFAFHNSPRGSMSGGGARAQIAVGGTVIAIAAVMMLRWWRTRGQADPRASRSRSLERFTNWVRTILHRGRSPVFAGLLGMSVGIPSVDYLAVLAIIATSRTSPGEQAAALVTFVLLGSLLVMTPLVGYLISPARTLELLDRFALWTRSRTQIEYAVLLALIGGLVVGIGISHL